MLRNTPRGWMSAPVFAVQGAVLDRLGDVIHVDFLRPGQIRDGAGHLDHAGEGAVAQPHGLAGLGQQILGLLRQAAEVRRGQLLAAHVGAKAAGGDRGVDGGKRS